MKRHRWIWSLLIILLVGCVPVADPGDQQPDASTAVPPTTTVVEETVAVAPTASLTAAPDRLQAATPAITIVPEGEEEEVPVYPTKPLPESTAVRQLIAQAKTDLSERLGVSADEIGFINYESVTWRDGSLGCPRAGMAYTQVLTEGYRILLQFEERVYNYHGRQGAPPFLCEKPAKPGSLSPPPGLDEK